MAESGTCTRNATESFVSKEEGTKVVEEGTQLVAAASELLSSASSEESLKTRVVDEVVGLMENIAAVSMKNRKISTEVEGGVKELLAILFRCGRLQTMWKSIQHPYSSSLTCSSSRKREKDHEKKGRKHLCLRFFLIRSS